MRPWLLKDIRKLRTTFFPVKAFKSENRYQSSRR